MYADMQASDCWWFEYSEQLDVIADDQKITLELRAIALSIWNYIKTAVNLTRRIYSWSGWDITPAGAGPSG